MDLKEFERQVLAGEITDFEPYFEEGMLNYHLRYILEPLKLLTTRLRRGWRRMCINGRLLAIT